MPEPVNLYKPPESRPDADPIIVRRRIRNLAAAAFCWSCGVVGMLLMWLMVSNYEVMVNNHWESRQAFLRSSTGAARIIFDLMMTCSVVVLFPAGYAFFRVRNRQGLLLSLTAFGLGCLAIVVLLIVG